MKKSALMKKAKKGFTLMEIIFVVVIIGVMAGIVIPKILTNSQKSQLMSTVQSDAKTIISKVAEWKTNDPAAKGSYMNMAPALIADYMPSNMPVENSTSTKTTDAAIIDSSGYGNSLTYAVKGDSANSIQVTVDYSKVITNANDQKKYGKQIGNVFVNLSQDKTNTTINSKVNGTGGKVEVDKIVP